MKKIFATLSIITTLLLITACGSNDQDPRVVYNQFNKSLSQMTSVTDSSLDKYITRRAVAKKNKGMAAFKKMPEAQRKALGMMALGMIKESTTWDMSKAKLTINGDRATLKTVEVLDKTIKDPETVTTSVLFVKESGWKIDKLKKENKSKNSTMSTGLF